MSITSDSPPTATAAGPPPAGGLDGELTLVQSELGRADAKAATLLAVATVTATLTLAVLTGRHLPGGAAQIFGWTATGLLAGAVLLLTRAVRPNLSGHYGFMVWAEIDPDASAPPAKETDADDDQARRLVRLSRLARTKYRLIRAGVDLLAAAVIVLAIAALTGAVTR